MLKIESYLLEFGESHRNPINIKIHWVCIPIIMFSVIGLLYVIPFPGGRSIIFNWATIVASLVLIFYLKLSYTMFLGFLLLVGSMILCNAFLFQLVDFNSTHLVYISLGLFVSAWAGEFIGHRIEGSRPTFLQDIKFLFIGPIWLMHFIYGWMGVKL